MPTRSPSAAPRVAAVVPWRGGERAGLVALLDDLRAQRGVRLEILVVDASAAGELLLAGAQVVREPSPSRGLAYARALERTSAPWIAWCTPGARYEPGWLAATLERLQTQDELALATAEVCLLEPDGTRTRVSEEERAHDAHEPGGWESGVIVRRDALETIAVEAFAPAELELLRRLRARGACVHLDAPLVALPRALFDAARERTRIDAGLLALASQARAPGARPEISVLLATHDRRALLAECLEGFARQLVPPGTLELVVIDDGSRDGTEELVGALSLGVPLTYLRVSAGGAARARNAGLPLARGRWILFVNDDTIPFPDTVARHLDAQRELADRRAIVLGTFEQPSEHLGFALTRLIESTRLVFGYADWSAGQELPGEAFYTCNLSLPAEALADVGSFDAGFAMYAEDTDLGLRLGKAGWTIHYRPECRSIHRHLLDFELLRWRQRAVAKAHVRLFRKHPELLIGSSWAGLTRLRLERQLASVERFLPDIERAARTLSGVRCDALEQAGGEDQRARALIEERLAELFLKLNALWWNLGFQDGLREHGLASMAHVFAGWSLPCPPPEAAWVLLRAVRDDPCAWLARLEAWLAERAADGAQDELLVLVADGAAGLGVREVERLAAPVLLRALRNGALAPLVCLAGDAPTLRAAHARARAWIPTDTTSDRRDAELASLAGLERRRVDPRGRGAWRWPIASAAAWRVLAWPDWRDARSLSALARALAHVPRETPACFVLRRDPSLDADPRPGLRGLRDALAPLAAHRSLPEIVLEEAALEPADWMRLARSVEALLCLPCSDPARAALLAGLGLPELQGPEDVQAFLASLPEQGPRIPRAALEELAHA